MLLVQPIPVTHELFAGMKTSSFSIPGKPSSLQTAISGGTSGAIAGAGLASLLGTSTPWGAGIGAGIGLLGSLF